MIKTQPYKTTFESLYDMEAYIGKEFGLSDWMTIDQESINAFAKNTEDEQWIHIDPERCAKESPYKKNHRTWIYGSFFGFQINLRSDDYFRSYFWSELWV